MAAEKYVLISLSRKRSILLSSFVKISNLVSSFKALINIIDCRFKFPEAIENSLEDYQANVLCAYLYELSGLFNNFYETFRT